MLDNLLTSHMFYFSIVEDEFDFHRQKAVITVADDKVRLAIVRTVIWTLQYPPDRKVHIEVVRQSIATRAIYGRLALRVERCEFSLGEIRKERRHRVLLGR